MHLAGKAGVLQAAAPRNRFAKVRVVARGARPKQWLKNLLVFAAPAAAGRLASSGVLVRAGLAFVVFSLVASATYLFNDVVDAGADSGHPHKASRPVAAGELSKRFAIVTGVFLATTGLMAGLLLGWEFEGIVLSYLVLTVAYSLWLQRVAVLDIALVASFFVLRALAGGAATEIAISPWFLILTSCVALLVVAGKRYSNMLVLEPAQGVQQTEGRVESGKDEVMYTTAYLRYVWMLASALALAAYTLWAFAVPHIHGDIAWSELSIVPFALAILRYALVLDLGRGGSPEDVILGDRALQVFCLLWAAVYGLGVNLHG
jgi:decaprenyl-phosphate phosphoribosyltransferase